MDYKEVLERRKQQLEFEVKILKETIKHYGGKGDAAEQALKRFLRDHLPKKYSLNKGFVVNNGNLSPQHDLIVYDENINIPILSTEDSVYLAGGSVYGVIEITLQKLNVTKLEEDIKKLGKLRKMFPGGKVGFKNFTSVPVIDKEQLNNSLESGFSIEDVWEEGIRKGYWGKSGDISEKLKREELILDNMTPNQLKMLKAAIIKNEIISQHTVVGEKELFSSPPPRAYICALAGTTYTKTETLKENIMKLTIEHGVHLHGLFVLGATDVEDWFFANIAYSNNKVYFKQGKVMHNFLASMIRGFNGMLVGKYPALMETE